MAGTTAKTPRKSAARRGAAGAAGARDTAPTPVPAVACACGVGVGEGDAAEGRKAHGVDPEIKARNVTRLRRIEGQVRGLQQMVENDRYCADVMTQLSAVQEALRSVSRELMRNHLKHCATSAITSGPDQAEAMYDELVDMMYKHSR
jgi:DNA-binding FrmR family transcriptional regulator